MQALVVTPGEAHSARVAEVGEPRPGGGEVLLRTVAVGVCGTDREISEGLFGTPPAEGRPLVLGHELLATVERDGHGFSRGDLVTATVRRSCGHCLACDAGSPDACLTGDYDERGIVRLDGFDLVIEAAGDAQVMLDALGLLGRNGVACLLGLDGRRRKVELHGPVLGVDAILENRTIFGSVNCHRVDWEDAATRLNAVRARWPDALESFVGLAVPVDRFQEAFDFRGIKATLAFAG